MWLVIYCFCSRIARKSRPQQAGVRITRNKTHTPERVSAPISSNLRWGGEWGALIACLSHLTIDYAPSLLRRSALHTPSRHLQTIGRSLRFLHILHSIFCIASSYLLHKTKLVALGMISSGSFRASASLLGVCALSPSPRKSSSKVSRGEMLSCVLCATTVCGKARPTVEAPKVVSEANVVT